VPLVDASKMSRVLVDLRLWTFDSAAFVRHGELRRAKGAGKNPHPSFHEEWGARKIKTQSMGNPPFAKRLRNFTPLVYRVLR
jgi:hypothetical protein